MEIDNILARAKLAAEVKNDSDFASLLGMTPQAFNNRKKRGTLFPEIAAWAAEERINGTWILTGEGVPRTTGPPRSGCPPGVTEEEWNLILNYRCAGDEIREECFGMLERSAIKSRAKDGGGSSSTEMKSA